MTRHATHSAAAALAAIALAAPAAAIIPIVYSGPTPYLSRADSPLESVIGGICIEDFEDGALDVPGVTGNGSVTVPAGNVDSVDGDDGSIDGLGIQGHSYFNGSGATGITFTFDPNAPGGLPRQVGVVWTDGGGTITFEAFNPDGVSLDPYGPFTHADGNHNGGTAEDRFYGIEFGPGVSKITIINSSGGIEVDHLQFDRCFTCADPNNDQSVKATDALYTLQAGVGTKFCASCVCDVNDSASITAVDALIVLKAAVGQEVELDCSETCEDPA